MTGICTNARIGTCDHHPSLRSLHTIRIKQFAHLNATNERSRSLISAAQSRRTIIRKAGGVTIGIGIAAAIGVSSVAVAAAMANDPQALVRTGMSKFVKGDVEGSLVDFDAALAAREAIRPYLWQRGLTLYYLDRYEEGAKQFRDDVAVNPNDTEESIWAFLCEAQLYGPAKARENFLIVGRDPRPVMRAAQSAFMHGSGADDILKAAGSDEEGHDAFYALLYVGLYNEAEGRSKEAEEAMLRAVGTRYCQTSGDYMAALARVHCKLRGWQ